MPSRERCLESPDRRREIGGVGLTRHVGAAVGVERDPVAPTVEENGIDEDRAGGVEFRHEAAARYVGVAVGVHGYAVATAAIAKEVAGLSFVTKAPPAPPKLGWKVPAVVGKSEEAVKPVT